MTYCAEPGCGVLVARGRCPAHTRDLERFKGSRQSRGYGNKWARRSRLFRQRFPLCGMRPNGQRPIMSECFDQNRVTLAYQVDHVIPHHGDPGLFWDEIGNWQSLCAQCGSRKSAKGL